MRAAAHLFMLGLLAALPGCLEPVGITCADGSLCAPGEVCGETGGCFDPDLRGCGNGLIEPDRGETCDDGNVDPGDGCSATCNSDEVCGNGVTDYSEGELCDCGDGSAGPLPPGCAAPNGDEAGASCFTTCQPHGCGDGLREGLEACEGADLQDLGCTDVGFYAGTLGCDAACRFDTTACAGSCGDGEINGPEFCEEFVEGSCVQYGLDYGRPDCNAVCGISLGACGSLATPEQAAGQHVDGRYTSAWSDGTVAFLAGNQYAVCGGICQPWQAWQAYDGATWTDGAIGDDGVIGLTGVTATSVFGVLDDTVGTFRGGPIAATVVNGAPTVFEIPELSSRVQSIHSREVDTFVFGTRTGEIGRWESGVATIWHTLPSGADVQAVLETATGEIIAYTFQETWFKVTVDGSVEALALPLSRGTAVFADAGGDYVGDVNGRVAQIAGGNATILSSGPGPTTQILRDVDGALMAVANDRLLRIERGLTTQVGPYGVSSAFVVGGVLHAAFGASIQALPGPRVETSIALPPTSATFADDRGLWSIVNGDVWRGDAKFATFPGGATDVHGAAGVIAVAADDGVWTYDDAHGWTNLGTGPAAAFAAPAAPAPGNDAATVVWVAPDGVIFAASGKQLLRWDGAWLAFDFGEGGPVLEATGLTGSSSTDVYLSYRTTLIPTTRATLRFDGVTLAPFGVPYAGTFFQEQAYQLVTLGPDEAYASWDGETQRWDGNAWAVAWPEATSGLSRGPDGELWGVIGEGLAVRDEYGWLPIRGDLDATGRAVLPMADVVYVPRGAAISLWRR